MPLSGALIADFSSFMDACAKSEVSLKSFEAGGEAVSAKLTRVSDSLSGVRIVQQATVAAEAVQRIGGVSQLTANELARIGAVAQEAAAKLVALGQTVPPGIQNIADRARGAAEETLRLGAAGKGAGESFSLSLDRMKTAALGIASAFGVAFSLQSVVQFGKGLVDDAGALVDMNQKTGVSIEQLQRFAFVGKQANTSTEDFATSSFKLGVALASGKSSVRGAVEELGLSYATLKSQSPDEQFNTTVRALEGVASETERNKLGVELFGKSFQAIAAAIASGYTDMAKQAQVSTTAQIKAIDDASDRFDRWVLKQKTGLTSTAGEVLIAGEEYGKLSLKQQILIGLTSLLGGASGTLAVNIGALNLAAEQRAKQVDIALPKEKEQIDVAAAYARELSDAELKVSSLSAAETAGIAAALLLGESHDKIAVAFDLSDKALALFIDHQHLAKKAAEELAAANKTAAEVEVAYGTKAEAIWETVFAAKRDLYTTDTQRQQGKALSDYDRAVKEAQAKGVVDVNYYNGLWALYEMDAKKREAQTLQSDQFTKEHYRLLADKAKESYDFALDHASSYTSQEIQLFHDAYYKSEQASNHWAATASADMDAAAGHVRSVVTAVNEITRAEQEAAAAADKLNAALKNSVDITAANFDQAIAGIIGGYNSGVPWFLNVGWAQQLAHLGYSVEQILRIQQGGPLPSPPGPRIPGFKDGVENFAGGWATVGERGPETMYVPQGASIFPNGSAIGGGGGGSTIHAGAFVFNLYGTPESLVEQVKTRVMREAFRRRQFGAA